MIATGPLAFANARVRALKSRLLGREIGARVAAGLAMARDVPADGDRGFRELLQWYAVVLASYPRGHALVRALLRRHEIENLKLVWRAVINRHDAARWTPLWTPLDRLATITRDDLRDCRTLPSMVEALQKTPYGHICEAMWRAHAPDALAAEIGFDRWVSRDIVDTAAALPRADRTAAALAGAVVRERDFSVLRRSAATGLAADVLTGGDAPLPRQWHRRAMAVTDWDRWLLSLRRHRRELCRRAFLESPFCLSPAIALLLLKEEEVRGLEAISAFERLAGDARSLDYALAAGGLGA